MPAELKVIGSGVQGPRVLGETLAHDSLVRPVKRVMLIFPPMVFSKYQSRQTAMFPLGLGYIASVLERAGYEIELIDCPSEGYETNIDIGKDRIVYGLLPEQIRSRIEAFQPDAVGISCLFSTLDKRMLMVARIAKEVNPEILTFSGGPHVSAFYERITHDPAMDYCITGEGEDVAVDLLAALNAGGEGIENVHALCLRRNGQVIFQPRRGWIEDLDTLPLPARHLVDREHYWKIGKVQGLRKDGESSLRLEQMTTSRGCPFMCKYCAKDVTWGKGYRTRSAKDVLDEMEHLIEHYGIERFAFQDDNFTANMDRAAEIFDGIIERGLDISWEAHNGLGVNFLSPELLEKMKASGCAGFTIAVESASDATLKRVRKPNYIKRAPPIVEVAKQLGIEVRGFFMIGFPGESLEEVKSTIEYAAKLDLAVSAFALVTPLPGTQLYKECVREGMIDEKTVDFEDFSFGAFELQLSQVPVEQLKMIRKIEWLKTVLLDRATGQLKEELNMSPGDVLDELRNGMQLLPEQDVLRNLYHQAVDRWGQGAAAAG